MTTSSLVPPMADLTGYRLIKLGEQLLDQADEALTAISIKARHLNVLVTVLAHPDMSQQELSEVIGIDVNGMVVAIDFLEKHGLAVRARNSRDRRRHVVQVTEKGLQVVRRGSELVAKCQEALFAPLSGAEITELHRLTGRLMRIDDAATADALPAPRSDAR